MSQLSRGELLARAQDYQARVRDRAIQVINLTFQEVKHHWEECALERAIPLLGYNLDGCEATITGFTPYHASITVTYAEHSGLEEEWLSEPFGALPTDALLLLAEKISTYFLLQEANENGG